MAIHFKNGIKVTQENTNAIELLEIAIGSGDIVVMINLIKHYENGNEIIIEIVFEIELNEKAIKKDSNMYWLFELNKMLIEIESSMIRNLQFNCFNFSLSCKMHIK
jgi:hypothetical protein